MEQKKMELGRRAFLGSSAVAVGGVAATGLAAPARAATPASYPATPIPNANELHTLRRWTYGYRLADLQALRAAGSPQAWFEQQLDPASISEAPGAETDDWWLSVHASPETILQRHYDEVEFGWEAMQNYMRFTMLKRINTRRPVLELMTEFWEDHLYIPRDDDGVWPFRADFGHTMRRLALTSFEELLLASTTHPAMGCSLDNARSQKKAINENLGRELLELHTVGQGQYSEDDVKASAKMLTGYRVEMWSSWRVYYHPEWHWTGPLQIMDFTHENSNSDGREATAAYLRYLAHHPATARRIAKKLAQRFVKDNPSEALISHLAAVYLAHDTQVKPVLRALFAHEDFWASKLAKVRTPTDEAAAMYRALGTVFAKPTADDSGANSFIWAASGLGALPWDHPRPDGPPRTNDAWVNPSRFLASWDIHWGAAGGWWPKKGTTWITPAQRLPQSSLTLAELVDHLSRLLTGEASTSALLDAICTATEEPATDVVNSSHPIVGWKMPLVLALILNQPHFYLR